MADGTRDWGNGLRQMSLLAREEEKKRATEGKQGNERTRERVFEETLGAPGMDTWGTRRPFSPSPILHARFFARQHRRIAVRLIRPLSESGSLELETLDCRCME